MVLLVSNIQRFCMHDGDGLRTTVFLKGYPLKCRWCHNPETQRMLPEILFYKSKCIECGNCKICPQGLHDFENGHIFHREGCNACGKCADICPTKAMELAGHKTEIKEITERVALDLAFNGDKGGVTISGGEPTCQAEGLIALLKEFKERGINTALETCGYFDASILSRLVKYTDEFLWDIKGTDNQRHKEYTGGLLLKTCLLPTGLAQKRG